MADNEQETTAEKSSVVGDAAKLREVVIRLRDRIGLYYKTSGFPTTNGRAHTTTRTPPLPRRRGTEIFTARNLAVWLITYMAMG